MTSTLERLSSWYHSRCNGDWEHACGVVIETLDNPGWRVRIDLSDTRLCDLDFESRADQPGHETDWMRCWTEDSAWMAACGPRRLEDALEVFLAWAETAGDAG